VGGDYMGTEVLCVVQNVIASKIEHEEVSNAINQGHRQSAWIAVQPKLYVLHRMCTKQPMPQLASHTLWQ
jgi:hypothetical protein